MQELVALERVGLVILILGLGLAALGAAALVTRLVVRRTLRLLRLGLALLAAGVALPLSWAGYRWAVRLDPATEYVGLHRPGVLLALVAIVAAAGAGLGGVLRRRWRGPGPRRR